MGVRRAQARLFERAIQHFAKNLNLSNTLLGLERGLAFERQSMAHRAGMDGENRVFAPQRPRVWIWIVVRGVVECVVVMRRRFIIDDFAVFQENHEGDVTESQAQP